MSLDLHRPLVSLGRTHISHMSPQYKTIRMKVMSSKIVRENHTLVKKQPKQQAVQPVRAQTPTPDDPKDAAAKKDGKLIFAPAEGQYLVGALDRENLDNDPFLQFHEWFSQASTTPGMTHPEATTLSTAHMPSGRVSARMVYLKELDSKGFVIYSNWETSRKSEDIRSNGHASLTFWWKELERQVRVEGITERLTPEQSQTYYDTRIRGSRIGAWASRQSSKLRGREELEQQVKDVEEKFEGQENIPVPPFWGGLRIVPTYIEFWQGRDSRLHDRFTYTRESIKDNTWTVDRVSP